MFTLTSNKYNTTRKYVICKDSRPSQHSQHSRPSRPSRYPIFQLIPVCKPDTVDQIGEYLETSRYYTLHQKRAYFECMGLDYEKITEYYPVVKSLNKSVSVDNSYIKNIKENIRIISIFIMLCLHIFSK